MLHGPSCSAERTDVPPHLWGSSKKRREARPDPGQLTISQALSLNKRRRPGRGGDECAPPARVSKVGALLGTRVYFEGYTEQSALELKRLVSEAGGVVCQRFSVSDATHVVCTSMCPSKKAKVLGTGGGGGQRKAVHVVHPEWVVRSCEAGHRLPEGAFDPETWTGSNTASRGSAGTGAELPEESGEDTAIEELLVQEEQESSSSGSSFSAGGGQQPQWKPSPPDEKSAIPGATVSRGVVVPALPEAMPRGVVEEEESRVGKRRAVKPSALEIEARKFFQRSPLPRRNPAVAATSAAAAAAERPKLVTTWRVSEEERKAKAKFQADFITSLPAGQSILSSSGPAAEARRKTA